MTSALIVGALDDVHVTAVREHLSCPTIVFDAESLARMQFSVHEDQVFLDDGKTALTVSDRSPARGWLRRVAPQGWQEGVTAPSLQFAEMSSWLSLLSAIARRSSAQWLTHLDASVRADNKLVVQHAAKAAGVRMPRTAVTNDPRRLGFGTDVTVVVKPLGPGHYVDGQGVAHNVFAATRHAGELTAQTLAPAPFLVQQRLDAAKHRRVVTVCGAVWSATLDATGLPLDWRSAPAAHHSFELDSAPEPGSAGGVGLLRAS